MQEPTQALEEQWYAAHERYDYAQSDRIARQIMVRLRAAAERAATAEESERLRTQAMYWELTAAPEGQ